MIKYRKYFYIFSTTLVVASVLAVAVFGLSFGIDFNGGSLLEVEFKDSFPKLNDLREKLVPLNLGEIVIQNVGDGGAMLRFAEVDEPTHQNVLNALKEFSDLEELRFESVGPVIGEETKQKSSWAILFVSVMILVYVAWAFKKVSYPVSSWQYGVVALIALIHDIIITVGVMAFVGHFTKMEVGVPFVAALLTILGYSVNDTIVIFDRIRENLIKGAISLDFEAIINRSLKETYFRSFTTGISTLFVLFAILFFGEASTQHFVLTLIIGIIVGTYSSIFFASPLLFSWAMLKRKSKR